MYGTDIKISDSVNFPAFIFIFLYSGWLNFSCNNKNEKTRQANSISTNHSYEWSNTIGRNDIRVVAMFTQIGPSSRKNGIRLISEMDCTSINYKQVKPF